MHDSGLTGLIIRIGVFIFGVLIVFAVHRKVAEHFRQQGNLLAQILALDFVACLLLFGLPHG